MGIEKSPLDTEPEQYLEPQIERVNYKLNRETYMKMYEHFKACTDVFYLICKSRHNQIVLRIKKCSETLTICERVRFAASTIVNIFRKQREALREVARVD